MKNKKGKNVEAGVGEKEILSALDNVIVALEDMSGKFAGQNLAYLRIAVDNAVAVAVQYRNDFVLFFAEKGG